MKIKVWISDQGEVFEGTQADLMREYGIKYKKGFSRPSGAADKNGDRWLEEDKFNAGGFKKPKLYLGHINRVAKDPKTGKKSSYLEGISETAMVYNQFAKALERPDHDATKTSWDYTAAEKQEWIDSINTKYEVINNKTYENPYLKQIRKISKRMTELGTIKNNLLMKRVYPNNFGEFTQLDEETLSLAKEMISQELSDRKHYMDKYYNEKDEYYASL